MVQRKKKQMFFEFWTENAKLCATIKKASDNFHFKDM